MRQLGKNFVRYSCEVNRGSIRDEHGGKRAKPTMSDAFDRRLRPTPATDATVGMHSAGTNSLRRRGSASAAAY